MTSFIGIGTGRCGSLSLAKIVGSCKDTVVYHETDKKFLLPWEASSDCKERTRLADFLSVKSMTIHGAVSMTYLNHVELLRREVSDLKVVCMSRPAEEVVESYLVFKKYRHSNSLTANWKHVESKLFPILSDSLTPRQRIHKYCEIYEAKTRNMDCLHLGIEDLNSNDRLKELFSWIEIPECNWRFPERRRWNERPR